MKRFLAATALTAAAVAALTGCTSSATTSEPLALHADDCTSFESALGSSIDGMKLESHSKIDGKGGQCVWSSKKGSVIAVDVDDKETKSSGDAKSDSAADKVAKDKSRVVIDNDAVAKFSGSVLTTSKGSEKSDNREFTATTDLGSTVNLITAEKKMTNDEASKIFTGLFAG